MRQIKSILLLIPALLGCVGCEEETGVQERKAVIEGIIRAGKFPYVLFSASVVPSIEGNISDAVINWGKVSISDGEKTVILTGRRDDSYMPPFVYYTFDMEGVPGKTYTLTADFKDLHATATSKMPMPVSIDSISLLQTNSASLRTATLHFTSPEDCPAYFYVSMQRYGHDTHPMPCLMGTIITEVPNAKYSLTLMRPRIKIYTEVDEEKYQSQFLVGEEWIVFLNRVERPSYDFWKAFDNMTLFSNSPFISANESLPSNTVGGYGVWSAEGSSTLKFKVE